MADIVAAAYPVSAITDAAARSKLATRRWPLRCCGTRRGAVPEREDMLAFYHALVSAYSYLFLSGIFNLRASLSISRVVATSPCGNEVGLDEGSSGPPPL